MRTTNTKPIDITHSLQLRTMEYIHLPVFVSLSLSRIFHSNGSDKLLSTFGLWAVRVLSHATTTVMCEICFYVIYKDWQYSHLSLPVLMTWYFCVKHLTFGIQGEWSINCTNIAAIYIYCIYTMVHQSEYQTTCTGILSIRLNCSQYF